MAETADVLIIGAGIMGASTAYHLARRRFGRIVVLERDTVCSGSSALASGGIRHQYANRVGIELTRQSILTFENFQDEFGVDPQFRQHGYLILVTTDEELAAARHAVALQQSLGVDVRLVSPDDMKHAWPYIDASDLRGATFSPRDGYADPYLATTAIAARARDLGVVIKQHHEVTGFVRAGAARRTVVTGAAAQPGDHVSGGETANTSGGDRVSGGETAARASGGRAAVDRATGGSHDERITGVVTAQATFEAPIVVIATGAWSGVVGTLAGLDVPVRPRRRQKFITAPFPADVVPAATPFVIDRHAGVSVRREGAGLLLGIAHPDATPDFRTEPDWRVTPELIERIVHRVPALADARLMRAWAGLYEMTPDQTGIVSAVPGVEGLYVVAGFSGHGFMHGPIAGQLMAELIANGRAITVDATPLALDRFARGVTTLEPLTFV